MDAELIAELLKESGDYPVLIEGDGDQPVTMIYNLFGEVIPGYRQS